VIFISIFVLLCLALSFMRNSQLQASHSIFCDRYSFILSLFLILYCCVFSFIFSFLYCFCNILLSHLFFIVIVIFFYLFLIVLVMFFLPCFNSIFVIDLILFYLFDAFQSSLFLTGLWSINVQIFLHFINPKSLSSPKLVSQVLVSTASINQLSKTSCFLIAV